MKVKAIFFDLYETLAIPPLLQVRQKAYRQYGIPYPQKLTYPGLIGFPLAYFAEAMDIPFKRIRDIYLTNDYPSGEAMLKALASHSGKVLSDEIIKNTQLLSHHQDTNTQMMEGAETLLDGLKGQGLKLALISNFNSLSRPLIKQFQLNRWFDLMLFSCEVGIRKPDREIFKIALERLNVKPGETLMVGDNFRSDIKPCLDLGIQPLWVKFQKGPFLERFIEILYSKRLPIKSINKLAQKLNQEVKK